MKLSALEFNMGWWRNDVPKLIQQADILFAKAQKEKWQSSAEKIIEARKWEPSRRLIEPNFQEVLKTLGFFYLSKAILPGPCFIFPLRDLGTDVITRAQVKPCYELMDTNTDKLCKYMLIGPKVTLGPNWLGNDKATIEQVIKQRRVVLVEGGFDPLACRLLCPQLPFLTPLKKSLSKEHETYLRMLGAKTLYLMFDNERAKEGRDRGAGNTSMSIEQQRIKSMTTEVLLCPSEDASACLENLRKARELKALLESTLGG
jgi:hypothetical protein